MWCCGNTFFTTAAAGIPWMMFIMPIFLLLLFTGLLFAFQRRRFSWCGNWDNSSFSNSDLAHEIQELRKEIEELRKNVNK